MKHTSYNSLAKELLKNQSIKVSTCYVDNFKYDENWIYLPRIYAYDYKKAKVRILTNGKDHVKNCLKITFDKDVHTKKDIQKKLNSVLHLIKYHINGTCQHHLTINNLEILLTCYDHKNKIKENVKLMLQKN